MEVNPKIARIIPELLTNFTLKDLLIIWIRKIILEKLFLEEVLTNKKNLLSQLS